MELIITIKEVLAVQLGNAASTQQVPPAYHHRAALTACSLTAGCTLLCGRRPSGDAFASIFDASNPAELGSSLLASSSLPRSSVCTRWWW